jgi:outer membrane protein OmpA-like peptidoglycan-associated protein
MQSRPLQEPYTIIETAPRFPDRVFFAPRSVALSPGNQEILRRWAASLKEPRLGATIEGHADDTGDDDADRALSLRRAEVVRDALILLGVPARKLKVVAYGNTRKINKDETTNDRPENRRVVGVPETIY